MQIVTTTDPSNRRDEEIMNAAWQRVSTAHEIGSAELYLKVTHHDEIEFYLINFELRTVFWTEDVHLDDFDVPLPEDDVELSESFERYSKAVRMLTSELNKNPFCSRSIGFISNTSLQFSTWTTEPQQDCCPSSNMENSVGGLGPLFQRRPLKRSTDALVDDSTSPASTCPYSAEECRRHAAVLQDFPGMGMTLLLEDPRMTIPSDVESPDEYRSTGYYVATVGMYILLRDFTRSPLSPAS